MYVGKIKSALKRFLFVPHLKKEKKLYINEFNGDIFLTYVDCVGTGITWVDGLVDMPVFWVKKLSGLSEWNGL